jgi:hypothetical protein
MRYDDRMRHLLLVLPLLGCHKEEDRTLPAGAPDDGQRLFLPNIEFNEWTDYLALQAAVDADCAFMDPLFEDDSTAYPPLQVFWVIYDKENDVKDGDEVINTYFDGDVIRASEFPNKAGKPPLGFKFPTSLQQSFLTVEETRFSDERRTLDARLGAPINAWMRVEVLPDGDACSFEPYYCELPCEQGDKLFESVYLELGAFFSVQSITWR